jgi:uncharacterized protein (TIGR03437 family)
MRIDAESHSLRSYNPHRPPAGTGGKTPHAKMGLVLSRFAVVLMLFGSFALRAQDDREWMLVWHDEFDGPDLDAAKWQRLAGGGGWGNQELQYHTAREQNARVEDGVLVIQALEERYTGPDGVTRNYTSARLTTQGRFSKTYGRFEARIKMPRGRGIWPGFWMLGDSIQRLGWPASGEIDIAESLGSEPAHVFAGLHGPGYSGKDNIEASYALRSGVFADDFHIFAVEWDLRVMRWYVDGELYRVITPADLPAGARWVFDQPFHLILSLAVGGTWPGSPDASTSFPQKLLVDYVRVYQRAAYPVIAGADAVVNAGSLQPGFSPGSWVTLAGSDFAFNSRSWYAHEIVNGMLPTQLEGTQVLFNGQPAYVSYISPNQINVQVPDVPPGPVTLQVVNNGMDGEPLGVEVKPLAPAFFLWGGKYAVATRPDGSLVGRPGLLQVTSTPARPGDFVLLWATGCGPLSPAVPPGRAVTYSARVTSPVRVRIAGAEAPFLGAFMPPQSAGICHLTVRLPDNVPAGDLPVSAEIAGVETPGNVFLTVAR